MKDKKALSGLSVFIVTLGNFSAMNVQKCISWLPDVLRQGKVSQDRYNEPISKT